MTIWIAEEALAAWGYRGPRQRGAQFDYSDQAIEAVLTLKEVYHLSNREAEGLVRSVFALMQVVLGSSGLKVYGEGEWKVRRHGWSQRRTWRKRHLSVDVASGEVQAAMLSTAGVSDAEMVEPTLAQIDEPLARVGADGAYDKRGGYASLQARAPNTEIVIPPRHNARI